jgi:aspartyl/asparaginyl beta-hydroxylase (cupin superfamily)
MQPTINPGVQARIAELAAAARHAAANGDMAAALRTWTSVLALSPGHPQALANLGHGEFVAGRHARAAELLSQAIAIQPDFAFAHACLARVHKAQGDIDAALGSIDAALTHEPTAWAARFEKAEILESAGRHREAALAWGTGLSQIPRSIAQSQNVQPLVRRAQAAVTANQGQLHDFLSAATADLQAGESARHLERFRHCLDILTGRRQLFQARPTMLAMPQLPSVQYFHREDFAWTRKVEAATHRIREEMEQATASDSAGFEAYVQTPAGELKGQFAPLDGNLDWSAYFLWKHGERIDAHCDRCPATLEALEAAPMVHVRSRAPAVLFSVLRPGAHIPAHNGPTNTRLTVHLPLVVPEGCEFRVGDEIRPWRPGELLIFDDTIQHEAWNRGTSRRVILLFDVWHPMLSELERSLVTALVEGIVDYYGAASELGDL